MAKALSSFPKEERGRVARRRTSDKRGGLGYWAALDYLAKEKAGKLKK